jgi:hypothetical protein
MTPVQGLNQDAIGAHRGSHAGLLANGADGALLELAPAVKDAGVATGRSGRVLDLGTRDCTRDVLFLG